MNFSMCDYRATKRALAAEDVAMLRTILRDYCSARHIDRDSSTGLGAARELIRLLETGVSDCEHLQRHLESAFPGA